MVEYRERQHDKPTPFFDKPGRLTVSGVERGEQRALYDARRDAEIPAHGLRLLVIRPADLDANSRGRLYRRDRPGDLKAVRRLDIAYGQLLRRMADPSEDTRYALVVPSSSVFHALRVPPAVRRLLRISVYEVTDDGSVRVREA